MSTQTSSLLCFRHYCSALVQNKDFRTHSDCLPYLDKKFLFSARKVLGLSLRFFPLPHHLGVKLWELAEAEKKSNNL